MNLFDKIKQDMYLSMKSGEKQKTATLRIAISKLKDKQIAKRDTLTVEEEIKVIQTMVKQRKESMELYKKGGRLDLAQQEETEEKVLSSYLPEMLSQDELIKLLQTVIQDVDAKSLADMGKVMPEVMKRGKERIDGRLTQQLLKQLLTT